MIENTVRNIEFITNNIKYRHAVHCFIADEEYGQRITKSLRLNMDKVKELSKLGNDLLNKVTIKAFKE